MDLMNLRLGGEQILLVLPGHRVLVVSDLHMEKASAAALRGSLLPPMDTGITLGVIKELVADHEPGMVVALGDSFHDGGALDRMGGADRGRLTALAKATPFVWVQGNHDPSANMPEASPEAPSFHINRLARNPPVPAAPRGNGGWARCSCGTGRTLPSASAGAPTVQATVPLARSPATSIPRRPWQPEAAR